MAFAADGNSGQGAERLLAARADVNLADSDGWAPVGSEGFAYCPKICSFRRK